MADEQEETCIRTARQLKERLNEVRVKYSAYQGAENGPGSRKLETKVSLSPLPPFPLLGVPSWLFW